MMFKFLGAFLLLCVSVTLAQRTAGDEQSTGPNTHSGKSKKIPIIFQSKRCPHLCLGTDASVEYSGINMYNCNTSATADISFSQYRYGNDGVFLIKPLQKRIGYCHAVRWFCPLKCSACIYKMTDEHTCNVTSYDQQFWFEGYGDAGWGIVRNVAKMSTPGCEDVGPSSLQVVQNETSAPIFTMLGKATEKDNEIFLWKIKKLECKDE